MAVTCANCGENLMGAVNRCWRCGKDFVSHSGGPSSPPIRRTPIVGPLDGAVAAIVIDSETDDDEPSTQQARWSRRGSPFATPGQDAMATEEAEILVDLNTPRQPVYPRNAGSAAGSVVAVLLGLVSLGLAFRFPVGALVVASFGLVLGCWGVYSVRRGAAIFGMLLCCMSFAIAGFNGAVELYTYVNGVGPFETLQTEDPAFLE